MEAIKKLKLLIINHWPLIIIAILGAFLRFYKLDWGEGFFFHPDERNIAHLAVSISPPLNLEFFTKGTFAYGSLVPYLVFGLNFFRQIFLSSIFPQDNFIFALFSLRLISALFSVLAIFLVYLIGKRFWHKGVGLLAAVLVAFSPGLIQAAHFGTFESILTFLYLLVFFLGLQLFKKGRLKDFFFSILIITVASAIKINSAVLFPLSILCLLFSRKKRFRLIKKLGAIVAGLLIFASLVPLFSSYYLTPGFKGMLNYEQQLIRGKIDVFYTRGFLGTKPIIFQFLKILPFLVNPFIILLLPFLLAYFLFLLAKRLIKRKIPWEFANEFALLIFLGTLSLTNAFVFAKWTRYMVPNIPFLALFVTVFIERFIKKWQKLIFISLALTSILWGLAFMSIYFHQDSRLVASEWIYQNLENNSFLLSETGNVLDVPLHFRDKLPQKTFTVKNFDFYNLEEDKTLRKELLLWLEKSDYILIPSRRIFAGMGAHPERYPLVSRYYQLLFSGKLGFKQIKNFTSYPKIWFLEFPDEWAEETWSVFDHPVIRIYKKVKPLLKQNYEKLLKI